MSRGECCINEMVLFHAPPPYCGKFMNAHCSTKGAFFKKEDGSDGCGQQGSGFSIHYKGEGTLAIRYQGVSSVLNTPMDAWLVKKLHKGCRAADTCGEGSHPEFDQDHPCGLAGVEGESSLMMKMMERKNDETGKKRERREVKAEGIIN